MRARRMLGGGVALLLVLTGATVASGAGSVDRLVVDDGTVEVVATVQADDVAAANQTNAVVDLDLSSDDGTVVALPGRFRLRDPQGAQRFVASGSVDDTRLRLRTGFTRDSSPGLYTLDVLSLPVDVTTPDGETRRLELRQDGATTFVVRPESQVSLDVAPESVPRGQTAYVHGSLAVARTDPSSAWAPFEPGAGAKVSLWFNPSGSKPKSYRGTATVDKHGYFGRGFTTDTSGTWSVAYAGTSTRAPAASSAKVTARSVSTPVRSAVATTKADGRAHGETLRARVILPRTITVGLTPKTVVADVGFLFPHQSANATWVDLCHHTWRVCSENPVYGDTQIWDDHTARTVFSVDAGHPAGTYRVGLESRGYRTLEENEYADADFSEATTITTVQVKHLTRLGVRTSKARPRKGATVTLSGRLLEARAEAGVKGYYGVRGAKVRVYFDPDGPRRADYRTTIRTGAKGVYGAKIRAKGSGTWVVRYAGSSKLATSSDTVRIRVR